MVGVASTCAEARGRDCCFLLVSSVALFLPRAQELLTLVFLCLSPGGAGKPTIKKKKVIHSCHQKASRPGFITTGWMTSGHQCALQ